jgi:hypothetical protein
MGKQEKQQSSEIFGHNETILNLATLYRQSPASLSYRRRTTNWRLDHV